MIDEIIKMLATLLFWVGGYALAPVLFMATMGIFKNLTGISAKPFKSLSNAMTKRGKENRGMLKEARDADRKAKMGMRAQRRGAAMSSSSLAGIPGLGLAAGRGRAALAANRRATTNQQVKQLLEDQEYDSWKGNGQLNKGVAATTNRQELEQWLTNPNNTGNKYYTNGRLDRAKLDQDLERVESMRSRYGTQALREAAHTRAMAGGTDYENAAEAWAAAKVIAGDDEYALSQMVKRGSEAGLAAGRADYSAGGYVATMKLAQSTRADGTISQADQDEYVDKVIEAGGASTLLHPSMKGEHAAYIADRLRMRSERAKAAYDAAPNDPRTKREYMRSLADIANVQDNMNTTSPGIGNIFADRLFSRGVTTGGAMGAPTPTTWRDEVERAAGRTTTTATVTTKKGNTKTVQVPVAPDRDFLDRRRELTAAQQQNAALTAGAAATPTTPAGGGPTTTLNSDVRLKHDIEHLYTLDSGIKIYSFRYLWSDQVYVGVMAQDLLATHPRAVTTDENGFYRVDYSALGLKMLTIEEWEQQKTLELTASSPV